MPSAAGAGYLVTGGYEFPRNNLIQMSYSLSTVERDLTNLI